MQEPTPRTIAVFGSTGSIGKAALEVIKALGQDFELHSIAANRSISLLNQQIAEHSPRQAVLADLILAGENEWSSGSGKSKRLAGIDHLEAIARDPEVDIVLAAIVGSAGLASCLAAAESGKRLALANKEALVVAGPLLTDAVQRGGAELLPVDSEHSAIFQAIQCGTTPREVKRVILTASGGSLRSWPKERLSTATADDALAHPTWQMGKKITVDSATMMNKALEVIEAKWLFDLSAEQILVVIHPQSVIHSMVEFVDGSVVAQLCPPDMRLPIQYALTYPERQEGPADSMDWTKPMSLDWQPIDFERYPALELGFEVAKQGGTSGAVLNAANEAAVELFLQGHIRFTEIAESCRQVLHSHTFEPQPSLDDLMSLDRWARKELYRWAKVPC